MNLERRKRRQLSEINVVPYIDVMLVLLVIFMVTAPLLSQGVKVELPKAAAEQLEVKNKDPIIVSVDAQGNYYLNIAQNPGDLISPEQLTTQVTSELQSNQAANEKRQVLVKGDRNVDYGKVVEAMVLLQHAGAESVGLITEDEDQNTTKALKEPKLQ